MPAVLAGKLSALLIHILLKLALQGFVLLLRRLGQDAGSISGSSVITVMVGPPAAAATACSMVKARRTEVSLTPASFATVLWVILHPCPAFTRCIQAFCVGATP